METTTIDNELLPAISETGVDTEIQQMLVERFTPFLEQVREWKQKAETLVVTDISQTAEMKMARVARLAIRDIRLDADKTRKELKEDSLRYGRAVQGVYNVIEAAISPIEKHLEEQEKFKEREEAKQRAILKAKREDEAEPLRQYIPYGIDFSEITQEDFNKLINGAKLQRQQAIELAEKAEADRVARLKSEAEERERLRVENERLKSEAEEREKELQDERNKLEQHQRAANIEAARLRKEAEAAAAEQRAEADRLQKELDDKKAAEQRAEADRLAAIESDLSKGDKAKFADLLEDLKSFKTKFEFKSKKYKMLYIAIAELIEKIIVYANQKV
jgi:hypothetical protein